MNLSGLKNANQLTYTFFNAYLYCTDINMDREYHHQLISYAMFGTVEEQIRDYCYLAACL